MLKFLTSLVFVTLGSVALADNDEVPMDFCDPAYYECTDVQRSLLREYHEAGQAGELPSQAGVYSGGCYMVSSTYGPEQEHYGLIYIHNDGGKYRFDGKFSFFYPENPFKNYTIAMAEWEFQEKSPYIVETRQREWYSLINEEAVWKYFVRQTAEDQFVLVGFWGANDTVICKLTTNEAK